MINKDNVQSRLEFIKNFYREAFEQPGRMKAPEIDIIFYPYIGLHQSIRMRDGKAYVRLAELMADAPLAVQRALAFILVAKLMRRKVPKAADQLYRDYTTQAHMLDRSEESRKKRGRKVVGSSKGKVYDLDTMFTQLNERYFQNELQKPILVWTKRKNRSFHGKYHPTDHAVFINKRLDSPNVPAYIVEYILYHELLHIKHPIQIVNGRQRKHTREFNRDEKKFPYYEQAEKWLKYNM